MAIKKVNNIPGVRNKFDNLKEQIAADFQEAIDNEIYTFELTGYQSNTLYELAKRYGMIPIKKMYIQYLGEFKKEKGITNEYRGHLPSSCKYRAYYSVHSRKNYDSDQRRVYVNINKGLIDYIKLKINKDYENDLKWEKMTKEKQND